MRLLTFFGLLYLVAAVKCCDDSQQSTSKLRRSDSQAPIGSHPTIPVGKGDRFQGGRIIPRGLGTRLNGTSFNLHSSLNRKEIESALKGLAKEYGFETFTAPYQTYNGVSVGGGKIGGGCPDAYRIFFTAQIHAQERGAADNLLYFISDLLYAREHGTGLTYGPRTYTHKDVLKVLSTGIVFIPLVNPDGFEWDVQNNVCWRKNRNPVSSIPGNPRSIGVDLNRNYDFLWDFPNKFSHEVQKTNPLALASNDPASPAFHGLSPFSEPETRNVKWIMDTYRKVRWYMDIHSNLGSVLYSWGDARNQVTRPSMNFRNPTYNSVRGDLALDAYREYISPSDLKTVRAVTRKTVEGMVATHSRNYTAEQAVGLYPTSGSGDDYSFSRSQVNPRLNKVYGFTMEFGFHNYHDPSGCTWYPTVEEYHKSVAEVGAGLMEYLLAVTEFGFGDPVSRPCGFHGGLRHRVQAWKLRVKDYLGDLKIKVSGSRLSKIRLFLRGGF
ncbi:hypothetical protein G7Y89_g1694 [Cudoniella acicularis]|uniref:Peptidase M14 domain-containing protein n=1 Tax=Cudoniella acicularis TaxID=354080 RepID=A0A8H4W7N1_9HELO|nr:hypothetical protein G7Y89_g1694 [Cudoniella acicularis]